MLWIMLFTGVVVHMLNYSNLSIAITAMVKLKVEDEKPYVPFCKINSTMMHDRNENYIKSGEYNWSSKEKSILMGSFSWFMGFAQLGGALLCQKFGGKFVFAISNVSLGILSCLIPIASGFGVHIVIIIRAVQGIVGGMGIGVAAKALISKWVPPNERAKFLGIMAGLYFGASFSYFLNGWILHLLGWKYVFYVTGVFTFIWYIFWQLMVYETPREDPQISLKELTYIEKSIGDALSHKKLRIPWGAILTSAPVLVNTLVGIGTMWTTFTYLLYIPSYLQEIHGLPAYKIGELSSIPYLLEAVFAISFAVFADTLLCRKILSATAVRKLSTFFSSIVSGVVFGSLIFGECNTILVLTLLALAVMFSGASIAGASANIVDMSPNFCAVIHGLQGVIVMSTGHLSPLFVGYLTSTEKNTAQWNKVFLFTCAVNIVSGLLFFFFGDSNVQSWNYETNNKKEKSEQKFIKNKQNICQISLDYVEN